MTVCTILTNPIEQEVVAQLYAYLIELSMKSACEGCERGYCSQRDHSCLMDWEVRVQEELEQEMDKVDLKGLYVARLKAVFNTTYNSDMKPDKA